jgi:hypothetical protein
MPKAAYQDLVFALVIRDNYQLEAPFLSSIIRFFNDFFLRTRPDKLIGAKRTEKIVSGSVIKPPDAKDPKDRVIRLVVANGYIWLASLRKSASDFTWKSANKEAAIVHERIEALNGSDPNRIASLLGLNQIDDRIALRIKMDLPHLLLCKNGIVQIGCEEKFRVLCVESGEKLRIDHERLLKEEPELFEGIEVSDLHLIDSSWEEEGRKSLIAKSYRLDLGEIWGS